jgi:RNA-dependent RNA polymerase
MNKFKSEHHMLELCKRSLKRKLNFVYKNRNESKRFLLYSGQLCINREAINLLSYRGITSECLLVFLLRNIVWLIASLVSNQSTLFVLRDKVLHVLPWPQISHHPHLSKEPFFSRLLHTTISNNLYQLVTRAHIRVPNARYMFGVVDEHKVLKEGQVFVQITNEDGSKTVLKGPIAITKNPCRHPGDLRVLEAVDVECLYHLYDVLVFPQQGSRPHASEISGSDLDGDEYTVIWDPALIPTSPNSSPYAYDSGPAPDPLNRIVNRNDRLKVILDICEQDNLGRLSNIHLVLTDKFGIDSEEAISLAGGLSQELDSVKSGQHPYTSEQIKEITMKAGLDRPDFMQTPGHKEYPSDKILGMSHT